MSAGKLQAASPVLSRLSSQSELLLSASSAPADSALRHPLTHESHLPSSPRNGLNLSSSVQLKFPSTPCCCDDSYRRNLHLRIGARCPHNNIFAYQSPQIGPYFSENSFETLELVRCLWFSSMSPPNDLVQENSEVYTQHFPWRVTQCVKQLDVDSRAAAFRSTIQRDTLSYQGMRALEDARAAYCTIRAERKYLRQQIREQELRLRRLHDDAEAATSRLGAAMYQVGRVRDALQKRDISIDDDFDPDSDDSLDETLRIVHEALHAC